jgi:PAS domain-containing protein
MERMVKAMTCMENLLDALADCGEAAAFYKGHDLLLVNKLFAELFERDREEYRGLPIMEICHEDSVEMIRDFINRRAYGDHDVPTTYPAFFRTASNTKLALRITVIRTKHTKGAMLAIVQEIEPV